MYLFNVNLHLIQIEFSIFIEKIEDEINILFNQHKHFNFTYLFDA